MNVAVIECYSLNKITNEEGNPTDWGTQKNEKTQKGYRKRKGEHLKGKTAFESNRAKGYVTKLGWLGWMGG